MKRKKISNNLVTAKILAVSSVTLLLGAFFYAVFQISNYWATALSSCSTCSEGITKTFFEQNHLILLFLGAWSLFGLVKVTFFLFREYKFLKSIKQFKREDSGVYLVPSAGFAAWSGGIFAHSICIDKTFWKSLSSDERNALIAHENSHIDQGDALLFFLLGISESALAFPFIGRLIRNISKRIRLQSEYAADKRAIHATSRTALASLLHKALLFERTSPLIGPGIDSEIHERVKLLTSKSSYKPLTKKDRTVVYATLFMFSFVVLGFSAHSQPIAHCFLG